MFKYLAGGIGVIIAAVVAYYSLRGDPIVDLLNTKWQAVSIEQQRQKAIDGSASALKMFPSANVAAGVDVKTILQVVGPLLTPEGVTSIRVKGDEQLLHVAADFKRVFGPDDVPADSKYRGLLMATKPDIQGTISLSLGIAGAAPDQKSAKLQLKILPVFNNLHVAKVVLAEKADATAAGDALSFVLNRYASNVTAALNEIPILDVSVPTTLPGLDDPAGSIKISIPSAPDVKVSASAKPITNPFRVAGIATLIDGDHLIATARLVPTTDAPPNLGTVSSTFAAMKADLFSHLKEGLDISGPPDGVWVAVGKALLADGLNSAFAQAEPCVSAQGPIPKQSLTKTVPLPSDDGKQCDPSDKCDLQVDKRDCRRPPSCTHNHDERNCSGLGKPFCEAAKATQNVAYDADFNRCNAGAWITDQGCELEKGTQNGIYAANKAACETGKTTKQAACEAAKKGLEELARTGNLANIDVSMGGPANLKICFSKVKASETLGDMSLALGMEGSADIASHIKFVPLDIVGHLACPAEWTDDRTIKVTIPNQTMPVNVTLAARRVDGKQFYDGHVADVTLKLHFDPSPTVVLLRSANFTLACLPLAGLINAVTFNLAPLIPELLKDFDYKQKEIHFSFTPQLPQVKVLKSDIDAALSDTPKALTLAGTVKTTPAPQR